MTFQFWKLWTALVISNVCDGIATVAIPLLTLTLTRDPAQVAGITVATRLPWLLFALPAGALVDRLDRRWMMVGTDIFRTLILLLLSFLVWKESVNLPIIYLAIFLFGIGEVFFDTAAQTILPDLVSVKDINQANGYVMSAITIGNELTGPALGSLLFTLIPVLPFAFQSVGLAAATLLVFLIKGQFQTTLITPEVARHSTKPLAMGLVDDISQGFRWLMNNSVVRNLAIMTAILNLFEISALSVFILFALERMGVSQTVYGILLSAGAVGGLLASMVVSRLVNWLGTALCLFLSMFLGGITTTIIILVPNVYIVGFMLALISFVGVIWSVITVSIRQTLVPSNLLGRINSIYRVLSWGAIPLGALLGGILSSNFGLTFPFLLNTLIVVLLSLIALPFLLKNQTISSVLDK